MFADIGRHLEQFFDDKERCLEWLKNRQYGIKKSIRLVGKDVESLTLRLPITNEYITVYGESDEIKWLHLNMVRQQMYTID